MDKSIEEKIVSAFIVKRKQERALFELSSSKKRNHFIWSLSDTALFKEECMFEIKEAVPSYETIYALLKSKGAPLDGYCMCLESELGFNGKTLPLDEALSALLGYGPFLLSCLHGKLAYLECEQAFGAPLRYLLTSD